MARADDIAARFREHVAATELFEPPGGVVVAVSGGADSLALLHLLHAAAPDLGIALVVAHTDHGIHADSTRWRDVAARAATAVGVPFLERKLDLGASSSETRARAARYAALREMQREAGATYLATAHHADDQAETVLFRLLRGSGPDGLAGIPARGPHGLRRPLLPFSRDDLRVWLGRTHPELRPVEDPANADERHDRVWLRKVAIPMLQTRFSDLDTALDRVAYQAASQRRAWEILLREDPAFALEAVPGGAEVERTPLSRYHKVLSAALLRALCRIAGCRLRGRRVGALRRFAATAPSGRRLDLGDGWCAETVFGRLRVVRRLPAAAPADTQPPVAWGYGVASGDARWGEWGITWSREAAGHVTRAAWSTWVVGEGGEVRTLRSGDTIRPLGGAGRRPVRRLLMEARVPRSERARYPLVVRGDHILWIPGICRADVALPQPGEPAVRIDVRRRGTP